VGGEVYEIQLFINKVYNTKEETQEYEFIITYTDNKYLFQKIELLENIKNEKIQQAKDEEFAEKQREQEILEKKSQHQMF
jgi:ribonuclease HI